MALTLASCGGSIGESPVVAGALPPQNVQQRQVGPPRSAEHDKLLAAYGGVYNNPRLERLVASLVGRIVEASDQPGRSVRITILNSPVVNAFALPTGDLYLSRGLITLANDKSELAAVIAHELAHVTANHAQLRQRQARAAALARRVSDVVADPAMKLQTRETADLSLAAFSQRQEFQADEIGVKTLANAGFDPFAAARFLGSMARYAALPAFNAAASQQPGFLSSHPSTPARVANARRVARRFNAPGLGDTERDSYIAALDGARFGDDPSEGYVRGREFAHVSLGIAFTVPEGYVLKNTSAAVLATDGEHTAIRFDAVALPQDGDLQEYLRSGWVKGLISESVRANAVRGMEVAIASALVDGWSFRIGVVRGPAQVYRFIFASSKPASEYEAAFRRTLASFRLLSPSDKAGMRPLTVRVVKVQPGDTVRSLSERMDGVEPSVKQALFETLNGIGPDRPLRPQMPVKIIVE
ncbi:MAG: M48 family metalloprotease [Pseudomonadota bacterium]